MRSVLKGYTAHFKRKYGRDQPMFGTSYRARPLLNRREKLTAIAYVNENHGDHCFCEFCGHLAYATNAGATPEWLDARSTTRGVNRISWSSS